MLDQLKKRESEVGLLTLASELSSGERVLYLGDVLARFPVAMLEGGGEIPPFKNGK